MHNTLKQLRLCVDSHEVLELIKDVKILPTYDTKIGDTKLILPDSHDNPGSINLPDNNYGMIAKILGYLQFNGYLGHINYSGGPYAHMGKFRTLWNDLITIKPISDIHEIDELLIETWIRSQLDKNFGAVSIMRKFDRLKVWVQASSMLPQFMSIEHLMIYDCPSYSELEEAYHEAGGNWKDGRNPKTNKYPLHQLEPILQKAIEYVTKYTDDIELLMEYRQYLNSSKTNASNIAHRFMQTVEHTFIEPSLVALQSYCLAMPDGSWVSNPDKPGKGPRSIMHEAVQLWQAANLIILGFFTAARSNEISRQPRNIKTKKTKLYHLDQCHNFTRVIWKTARHGKLHTTPLPPLGLQAYSNLSRHSTQMDGGPSGKLKFNNWINLNSKPYTDLMSYLLQKFSRSVHGKNKQHMSPHQLRHAMASLMSHLNDPNGLAITAQLLGHESEAMTMTYEAQLETIIMKQLEYISDTNEEIKRAYQEYIEEESVHVLNEAIMPDLKDNKKFFGPAKGIMQMTGSIVNNPESFFDFYSGAIKAGEVIITQTPVCTCIRHTNNPQQMACQRGINFENYTGVPVQPAACQGSSCSNSLFREQDCEMLMQQTQSVQDLVPKDLRKIALEWFYVVGDGLEVPNKKIIDEYIEANTSKKEII